MAGVGERRQVTTERFPGAPRVAGPTVLMAKKSGGDGQEATPQEVRYKVPKPGISGKEGAKDIPSRFRGERPRVGEDGKEFAERLLRGEGKTKNDNEETWADFNKLKKFGDRSFEEPKK